MQNNEYQNIKFVISFEHINTEKKKDNDNERCYKSQQKSLIFSTVLMLTSYDRAVPGCWRRWASVLDVYRHSVV